MSIETIKVTVCDRCGCRISAIEDDQHEDSEELAFRVEIDGYGITRYEHVCTRCHTLLQKLWERAQPTDAKRKAGE